MSADVASKVLVIVCVIWIVSFLLFAEFTSRAEKPGAEGSVWSKVLGVLYALSALGWFGSSLFLIAFFPMTYAIYVLRPVISNEWAMCIAVALAVGLYRLRGSHPFFYGVSEVTIGGVAIWADTCQYDLFFSPVTCVLWWNLHHCAWFG
jgi:hypothetical protein